MDDQSIIELSDGSHEYEIDGRRLPGVTTILRHAGAFETHFLTDSGLERGLAVHRACEYNDLGELDEYSIKSQIRPYLEAWRKFLKDSKAEITEVELQVNHEVLGYCGTLDRIAQIANRSAVIEIKTGSPAHWHRLQTAAYTLAYRGTWRININDPDRCAIYLASDGSYSIQKHDDKSDADAFRAFLAVYNWKVNNGILKRKEKKHDGNPIDY